MMISTLRMVYPLDELGFISSIWKLQVTKISSISKFRHRSGDAKGIRRQRLFICLFIILEVYSPHIGPPNCDVHYWT